MHSVALNQYTSLLKTLNKHEEKADDNNNHKDLSYFLNKLVNIT